MGGCGYEPAEAEVSMHPMPAEAFLPAEFKTIGLGSYDDMIKQIMNIGALVSIVAVALYVINIALNSALGQENVPKQIVALMKNIPRTAMLAAVVLPILMQQIRNIFTSGIANVEAKVIRNTGVALVLAYVLLFRGLPVDTPRANEDAKSALLGNRLFDDVGSMIEIMNPLTPRTTPPVISGPFPTMVPGPIPRPAV